MNTIDSLNAENLTKLTIFRGTENRITRRTEAIKDAGLTEGQSLPKTLSTG